MSQDYEYLDLSESPTVSSLIELIGEDALAQLSIDFGGSVVSIPLVAGENSPISYCIGQELAQKLSDVWGGMPFAVPLRPGRKARVLRLLQENKPINLISRLVGISRTEIYRIQRAEEETKEQFDLF